MQHDSRIYVRRLRAKRKALGQCIDCCRPKAPRTLRCLDCGVRNTQQEAARRAVTKRPNYPSRS